MNLLAKYNGIEVSSGSTLALDPVNQNADLSFSIYFGNRGTGVIIVNSINISGDGAINYSESTLNNVDVIFPGLEKYLKINGVTLIHQSHNLLMA